MNRLFSFVILLSFISGCKKSQVTPNSDKVRFAVGAFLYDGGREYFTVEQGGVTVSIENTIPLISGTNKSVINNGTTFNLGEGIMLESPSLKDLPENLTLVFSKNGYGEYKSFFKNDGSTLYDYQSKQTFRSFENWVGVSPTLGMKSNVVVNSFSMQVIDSSIYIHCNISSTSAENNYIRLFMDASNPNITFENVPKISNVNVSNTLPVHIGDNTLKICTQCLKDCMHVPAGTKLYAIAYGDSPINNQYENPHTGEVVMPNVNRTKYVAPTSFIVP